MGKRDERINWDYGLANCKYRERYRTMQNIEMWVYLVYISKSFSMENDSKNKTGSLTVIRLRVFFTR